MNTLIYMAEQLNITTQVYFGFHILGFVFTFFYYICRGRKFQISTGKSILTVLIVYPIIYVWIYVLYWAETGFTNFGGNNIVRGFIWLPLVGLLAARLLKIKYLKMLDFLATSICVVHAISHLGCVFKGCCHGYPSSVGIYNCINGLICFPSQILESFVTVIIIFCIMYRERRRQYKTDGLSMPIMLILFGVTRFFLEFLRDNKKVWHGCSELALHALFMSVVGVVMYLCIKKHNKRKE